MDGGGGCCWSGRIGADKCQLGNPIGAVNWIKLLWLGLLLLLLYHHYYYYSCQLVITAAIINCPQQFVAVPGYSNFTANWTDPALIWGDPLVEWDRIGKRAAAAAALYVGGDKERALTEYKQMHQPRSVVCWINKRFANITCRCCSSLAQSQQQQQHLIQQRPLAVDSCLHNMCDNWMVRQIPFRMHIRWVLKRGGSFALSFFRSCHPSTIHRNVDASSSSSSCQEPLSCWIPCQDDMICSVGRVLYSPPLINCTYG